MKKGEFCVRKGGLVLMKFFSSTSPAYSLKRCSISPLVVRCVFSDAVYMHIYVLTLQRRTTISSKMTSSIAGVFQLKYQPAKLTHFVPSPCAVTIVGGRGVGGTLFPPHCLLSLVVQCYSY